MTVYAICCYRRAVREGFLVREFYFKGGVSRPGRLLYYAAGLADARAGIPPGAVRLPGRGWEGGDIYEMWIRTPDRAPEESMK